MPALEIFGRSEGFNLKKGSVGVVVAKICRQAGITAPISIGR